jgi:hypothetical protein
MLEKFANSQVRFGTEKSICFPVLNAIFDNAGQRDSQALCGSLGGMPHIQIELPRC